MIYKTNKSKFFSFEKLITSKQEELRLFIQKNEEYRNVEEIDKATEEIKEKVSKEKEGISLTFIISTLMNEMLRTSLRNKENVKLGEFKVFFKLCLKLETAQTFSIINDFFSSITLDNCIELWECFKIYKMEIKKSFEQFLILKYEFIKLCVALIQRSSRSSFPIFRAEILLYLSSILPFDDMSGMNLKGNINYPFQYHQGK